MQYMAKHNNIWQCNKTGKMLDNILDIPENDSINNYKQIRKPAQPVYKQKPMKGYQFKKEDNGGIQ